MQITTGIRSILSIPFIYSLYQKIVFPREQLIADYIKPYAGQKFLDIGCGTGNILQYLPEVEYIGIDASYEYIEKAKKRYQYTTAEFQHLPVDQLDLKQVNHFDTALAIGVLHHISDDEARGLFTLAKRALRPGGKLIAVEPCYVNSQSSLARWIISKDRGQNVKTYSGYEQLAREVFSHVAIDIRHDLLRIPYTLAIIECTV